MKRLWVALIFAMFMCVACVVVPGPRGPEVVIAPPLPAIVELSEPYYYHGGYHYYYDSDRWYYSQSRGGPWVDLPREHYPKEVRFKGKRDERGWGEHGHDRR